MYIWNETVGKRGSAEICSCLLHYFEHFVVSDVKSMIMFSDNCSGQNKNINVVLTCLANIHMGKFDEIKHYFMVVGHSFLPCDRNFAHIEHKLNGVEVFSQDNYSDIIKACRKIRPFTVVNMSKNLFLDVELLQNSITNRSGGKLMNGRVFVYTNTYKQGFTVFSDLLLETPVKVNLQKGRKQTYDSNILRLTIEDLPIKYPRPIKLDIKKVQDLQVLLDFIPIHQKNFMENLISEQQRIGDTLPDSVDNGPDDEFLDYIV